MCKLVIGYLSGAFKTLFNVRLFSLRNVDDHVYLDVTWKAWNGLEYRSFIDFDVIDSLIILTEKGD